MNAVRKLTVVAAEDMPPVSREAILEEAARLFGEQGYRGTRLEDVAARFGITRAALYYHFRNKQEMLFYIHLRAIRGLLDGAERILAAGGSPEVQLAGLLAHHATYVARHAIDIGVFHEEAVELSPEQRAEVNQMRRSYADRLIDLYDRGARAGRLAPVEPKLAVFALLGACNWVYRWYRKDGRLSPEEVGTLVNELLNSGYGRLAPTGSGNGR
jgi:AcrR family transcriptional regulator